MPRATIIIGFPRANSRENPFLVHYGLGGDAGQADMDASPAAAFEIYRQVSGLARSNPRAAANQAKLDIKSAAATPAADDGAAGSEPDSDRLPPVPRPPVRAPRPGLLAKAKSALGIS